MVHELEEAYGDKMKFTITEYTKGDAPDQIKKYDLGKHGMVIVDDQGEMVWSEPGHKQTKEGVEKAVKDLLKL